MEHPSYLTYLLGPLKKSDFLKFEPLPKSDVRSSHNPFRSPPPVQDELGWLAELLTPQVRC